MDSGRMKRACWGAAIALLVVVLAVWLGLGKTDGKPGDAGFVFVDGRYIDAPYRVSSNGVTVEVNGVVIYDWSRLLELAEIIPEDPGLPEGLTEYSNWQVYHDTRHDAVKRRYLFQHFPREVAMRKMAEYYSQLPFVASVTPVRPDDYSEVLVTERSGHVIPVLLSATRVWARNEVSKKIKESRDTLAQRLEEGDFFFFFRTQFNVYKFNHHTSAVYAF